MQSSSLVPPHHYDPNRELLSNLLSTGGANSYTVPMPSPAMLSQPASDKQNTLSHTPLSDNTATRVDNVNCDNSVLLDVCKQNLPLSDQAAEQSWSNSNSSGGGASLVLNPPLSPISESSSGVCHTASGVNTRSVSAAVSDESMTRDSGESMTGDSGVFEPSRTTKPCDLDTALELGVHTPQIQVSLAYDHMESILRICIEQAKNLSALAIHPNSKVQIKVALLPSTGPQALFCTSPCDEINHPKFHSTFEQPIQVNLLKTKTLDINVWSVYSLSDECMVSITEHDVIVKCMYI